MGGKRPDQYRIDAGEGGATDYKNLPQTGRGHSNLDDTVELDRQRVAKSDADEETEAHTAPAPSRRKRKPSRDANRPLREEERKAEHRIHPEPGAAETDQDTGNPLV